MNDKLVEQYARFLSESDTIQLFNKLEGKIGSLLDAAKECNITRKTVYDWKNLTHEIKLGTKEKILEQSLEKSRLETIEFLSEKMTDVVAELLFDFILTIYKKVYDCKGAKEVSDILKKFEEAKQQYAGILNDKFEYEINDLSKTLEQYADSIGIIWKSAPSRIFDTQTVSGIVKDIVYTLTSPDYSETPEELAIRLRIPMQIVTEAAKVIPVTKTPEMKVYDHTGTNNFISIASDQMSFGRGHRALNQLITGPQISGATRISDLSSAVDAKFYTRPPLVEGTEFSSLSSLLGENKSKTLVLKPLQE